MPDGTQPLALAGNSYGNWTVLRQVDRPAGRRQQGTFWLCQCNCGFERVYAGGGIRANRLNAKGCERCRSHGATKGRSESATYTTWRGMMERCNNPNHVRYDLYGGRGIKVCQRWGSFANFVADMGGRPLGMTLDRIDNSKGYEPGNCRWATAHTQMQNSSKAKLTAEAVRIIRARLENGEPRSPIADEYGVSVKTLSRIRTRKAWPNV